MRTPRPRRTVRLAIAALSITAVATPVGGRAAGAQTAAGAPAPCTATWDQQAVPEVGATDNRMLSITGTSPTSLYASGWWFPNSADSYSGRVLRNSGSGWIDLALPALHSDRVTLDSSTAPGPDEAWVGGSAYDPAVVFEPVLLHVVASTVARVTLPPPPTGYRELDSDLGLPMDSTGGSDLWVAGTYFSTDVTAPSRTVLYRPRSGGGWTQATLPIEGVDALDAVSPTVAYLGGQGLFRWSAGKVSRVSLPGNPPFVRDIASTGPTDVWVAATDGAVSSLFHFDGVTWRSVALPRTGLPGTTVEDIAVTPNGVLWVTGTWTDYLTHTGQWWVGRYHPGTGTWAAGPASPDAPTRDADAGSVTDLLALSGGNVYVAGSGDGVYESVLARQCHLSVGSAGLTPAAVAVKARGDVALVTADGTSRGVRVTDTTGLLSAGPLAPGQGAALRPDAAGTYRLVAKPGGSSATLGVPAQPLDGPRRAVTVYVASKPAPAGYRYQLQALTPGTSTWRWVGLTPSTGDVAKIFHQSQFGPGTYSVRARVINTTTGIATGWSPLVRFMLPAGA